MEKLLDHEALMQKVLELRQAGQKIVFTNGCFDILHPGHVVYLRTARSLGDVLIVGVNSDRAVRELKGEQRPILNQQERCAVLAGLESVSYVIVFDEPTPLNLIKSISPDVLVKGGDWDLTKLWVGRKWRTRGGR